LPSRAPQAIIAAVEPAPATHYSEVGMTILVKALACGIAVFAITSIRPAYAQLEIGTWVRQPIPGMPEMTMMIEACCNGGRRLTYQVRVEKTDTVMVVETRLDGAESPVLVNGKPAAETMAIKRTDEHHASTVMKMNGTVLGTNAVTLSADGKTLTVINNFGTQPAGKYTEIWLRK
jgi:hypothetical protein